MIESDFRLYGAVTWLLETNHYSLEELPETPGDGTLMLARPIASLLGEGQVLIGIPSARDPQSVRRCIEALEGYGGVGVVRIVVVGTVHEEIGAEVRQKFVTRVMTYAELSASFEKVGPYVDRILGDGDMGKELAELDAVYEEPLFRDDHGTEKATDYLNRWLESDDSPWLVVVGEYGTGKTALTRILQRRWAAAYREGAVKALPFRIELRDFTKQFNAKALLHHFMDNNGLGHLPVDLVESMISDGRVVLLLDGYDEMAQYLNIRERRACLQALADLASGRARGILTSRPNFFTEAEELRVFEALYQRFPSATASTVDRVVIDEESRVDALLERFLLDKRERRLEDLTPQQTVDLVKRRLADDEAGRKVVLQLLNQVTRAEGRDTKARSLAGKPVIVTYLLQVVEELKPGKQQSPGNEGQPLGNEALSEWQIYDLIIDNLMLRDQKRTPELLPSARRSFLETLAVKLSETQAKSILQPEFQDLLNVEFRAFITRKTSDGMTLTEAREAVFNDVRSSGTLTRSEVPGQYASQFSHNSLREFLAVEKLLKLVLENRPIPSVAITDSMRAFARSQPVDRLDKAVQTLAERWSTRMSSDRLGLILSLLWEGLTARHQFDSARALAEVSGPGLDLRWATLYGIEFGRPDTEVGLSGLHAQEAELTEVDFSRCSLTDGDFRSTVFDGCVFRSARVSNCRFNESMLLDCDITDISFGPDVDFTDLDKDSTALVRLKNDVLRLDGPALRGYLRYRGAKTDAVEPYFEFAHHPDFGVIDKILRYLAEETWRQRRGLEQRGDARANPKLAQKLTDFLLREHYVEERAGNSAMIGATSHGRAAFGRYQENKALPADLELFLRRELKP